MTMTNQYARFLLAVSLSGSMLFVAAQGASAASFSAKVVSVVDGDTINVFHDGKKERVIFDGVDCPELAQDFGEQARKFTDDACYHRVVTVEDNGRDSRGRTIGVVYLSDGTNFNEELVRQGLAWWSDKYAPNNASLKRLHNEAKTAHRGLWAAENPIPPWIFRNGERKVQAAVIKSK